MPFVRQTFSRREYPCSICAAVIRSSALYYRVSENPDSDCTHRICARCGDWGRGHRGGAYDPNRYAVDIGYVQDLQPHIMPTNQLALLFDAPVTLVETQVIVVDVSKPLAERLQLSPDDILRMTAAAFERFVCERLISLGLAVERVGASTYQRDGGIDFVACTPPRPTPFVMAVQVKHHKSQRIKTGPAVVRELLGAIEFVGFNAGLLVTNTTFTPDARWVAAQRPMLLHLRDEHDLQRWLLHSQLDDCGWAAIPDEVEVCPGVVVRVPRLP